MLNAYYTYHYSVDEVNFNNTYTFVSTITYVNIDALILEAAKDYQYSHGGWEDYWPLEITLFTADGKNRGTFEVHREFYPYFWANAKEE